MKWKLFSLTFVATLLVGVIVSLQVPTQALADPVCPTTEGTENPYGCIEKVCCVSGTGPCTGNVFRRHYHSINPSCEGNYRVHLTQCVPECIDTK